MYSFYNLFDYIIFQFYKLDQTSSRRF